MCRDHDLTASSGSVPSKNSHVNDDLAAVYELDPERSRPASRRRRHEVSHRRDRPSPDRGKPSVRRTSTLVASFLVFSRPSQVAERGCSDGLHAGLKGRVVTAANFGLWFVGMSSAIRPACWAFR